jgi:hypothetical protein
VTFTLNVQDADAPIVALERLTVAVPAVAVMVPPPQEPVSPFGVATVMPLGSVSVTPTPVSALPLLEFVIAKLSEVMPPAAMLEAPNALEIEGAARTVRVAVAVGPEPWLVELMAPVVLTYDPGFVAVTFTLNEQLAPATSVSSDRLTAPLPAVAVTPPQFPLSPLGLATVSPAGRLSVKAIPVADAPGLLFVTVNESALVWPTPMVVGEKDFARLGATVTVRVAFAGPPVGVLSVALTALVEIESEPPVFA